MQDIYDLLELHVPDFLQIAPNIHGVPVLRAEFYSTEALEAAFLDLVGNPIMKGHSSKAIGTALLIWKR